MKLIISENTDAPSNLALEEAILGNFDEDTILIWRNDKSVIIGRNQCSKIEVNHAECKNHGCKIVRRSSGGGAVYHDLGNVNYSFIYRNDQDELAEIKEATFLENVMGFLKTLGVDGIFTSKNDIMCNEHKISGTARMERGNGSLIHGTLLYDANLTILSKVLTPSDEKLKSNGVESVKDRVINIKSLIDDTSANLETNGFMSMLTEYIQKAYQAEIGDARVFENELRDILKAKYDDLEWNIGRDELFL